MLRSEQDGTYLLFYIDDPETGVGTTWRLNQETAYFVGSACMSFVAPPKPKAEPILDE